MRLNNEEFKGFVIGCVLGDASLVYSGHNRRNTTNNPHISLAHKPANEDYVLWKSDILKQLTDTTVSKFSCKYGDAIRVRSRVHPFYRKLEERFYHYGRKTVDEHLMKSLTVLGLLVWYLDDGNADDYTDNWSGIRIQTNCFTQPENFFMADWMKRKFDLPFDVHKQTPYYCLRLRSAFLPMLWNMFKPYAAQIPASMQYKLIGLERKAALRESKIQSVLISNGEAQQR